MHGRECEILNRMMGASREGSKDMNVIQERIRLVLESAAGSNDVDEYELPSVSVPIPNCDSNFVPTTITGNTNKNTPVSETETNPTPTVTPRASDFLQPKTTNNNSNKKNTRKFQEAPFRKYRNNDNAFPSSVPFPYYIDVDTPPKRWKQQWRWVQQNLGRLAKIDLLRLVTSQFYLVDDLETRLNHNEEKWAKRFKAREDYFRSHFKVPDTFVIPDACKDVPPTPNSNSVRDSTIPNSPMVPSPQTTPSSSPPPQKVRRRGGGRPSASFRLPGTPNSNVNAGSAVPLPTFPNGVMTPSKPELGPKFSKRGRLLKPNRARYSPEPEVATIPKEKLATTKKSYYVNEPSTQEGFKGVVVNENSTGGVEEPAVGIVLPLAVEEDEPVIPPPTSDARPMIDEDGEAVQSVVEVPKWRVVICQGFDEGESRGDADDGMSEETVSKRHQKHEVREKQRKRWDSQRLREESYLERLKRKQEEREKQKELRRQQRKRNRARIGECEEEESVLPSIDDIKGIHVDLELPIGAFGHPLPISEKVDFRLLWSPSSPMLSIADNESSNAENILFNKNSVIQGEEFLQTCCSSEPRTCSSCMATTADRLDLNKSEKIADISKSPQESDVVALTTCSVPTAARPWESVNPPSPTPPPLQSPTLPPSQSLSQMSVSTNTFPSTIISPQISIPNPPSPNSRPSITYRVCDDDNDNLSSGSVKGGTEDDDELSLAFKESMSRLERHLEERAIYSSSLRISTSPINLYYSMSPVSHCEEEEDDDEEDEDEDDGEDKMSKSDSASNIEDNDSNDDVEDVIGTKRFRFGLQGMHSVSSPITIPTTPMSPPPRSSLKSCCSPRSSTPHFHCRRSSGSSSSGSESVKSNIDPDPLDDMVHCPMIIPTTSSSPPSSSNSKSGSITFIFPTSNPLAHCLSPPSSSSSAESSSSSTTTNFLFKSKRSRSSIGRARLSLSSSSPAPSSSNPNVIDPTRGSLVTTSISSSDPIRKDRNMRS